MLPLHTISTRNLLPAMVIPKILLAKIWPNQLMPAKKPDKKNRPAPVRAGTTNTLLAELLSTL
jgi:hypothetical protein